ncbi:MAG: hypothetical protein J6Y44_02390 [Clostridia bacterium]|nr:hypothetical protein [Clostridia bacterium]MBP5373017.1 hypothetical protein [Clostridia bacterium]
MIWIIDIIAVVALLFVGFGGYRRGLAAMSSGALVFFLRIVLALALGFLILLAFQATGAVDALTLTFDRAFGLMPIESIGDIQLGSLGNFFATVTFGVISFAISYVILMIAFHFIEKLFKNFDVSGGTVGLVNRILGAFIGVTVYMLIVAIILAFIHAFAEVGLIVYFDEVLRACPLTGLLYSNNGFSKVVGESGIAQFVQNLLRGGLS